MNESRFLEYKREISQGFLKTVCAFSNYDGGSIIFGIDDNGVVCGFKDLDKACLQIEDMINDNIDPNPDYIIEKDINNKTINLIIYAGENKPYFYKGKSYKRNDTSTIQLESIELKRLIIEGMSSSYDALISNKKDLKFNILEKAFKEKIKIEKLSEDVLKTLKLKVDDKYNIAAELLADENDSFGIDIVRFGDNLNIFLERETINNVSLLTQYDKALSFYKRYYQYEELIGSKRVIKEVIPEIAFREALINAIAHRTYDIKAAIRVSMWWDKIEIYSPGALPRDISEEEYLKGNVSILRNPIIGDILNRLGYIEKYGTGIRKINEAYRKSFSKPIFEISDNQIKIVLPRIEDNNLNGDQKIIYDLTSKINLVSSGGLAYQTGFSKTKTKEILKKLVDENYLEIKGNGRGTKYKRK